ncbi:MAG: GNAT family N-acetyltransferase [Planctomycetes bacterium]|nr:GNAT family N-acetyltransferase [Planctomycetota bacterium]
MCGHLFSGGVDDLSWLQPMELGGEHVVLQPLAADHRDALVAAAGDGELWKLWFTGVPSAQNIDAYLDFALQEQELGRSLPFAVIHRADGKVVGSTRFCNVEGPHRRAEIGYTWYGQSYQRTPVNSECKLLLLEHAFDQRDAVAVEFRTHCMNFKSREAILRLGAKLDGVLRNHRIEGESFRDTAVYSIVRDEWPAVKMGLLAGLGRL